MEVIKYLFLFLAIPAFANVNKRIAHNESQLSRYNKKIKNLRKDLIGIERSINKANSKFEQVIEVKSNLEKQIDEVQLSLKNEKNKIAEDLEHLKSLLMKFEVVDNDFQQAEAHYLIVKSIHQKKKNLITNKNVVARLNQEIKDLQDHLSNYHFIEQSLVKKLENLSKERKRKNWSLANRKNKKNDTMLELSKLRKQQTVVQKRRETAKKIALELDISLPASTFSSMTSDNSGGVNLEVESGQKIQATSDGLITYVGALSSYGNVIVIKHPTGHRSVILGKFVTQVKKSQRVKKGELLAKTIGKSGEKSRVYFEIRKNKKKLSVSKFLAKNYQI